MNGEIIPISVPDDLRPGSKLEIKLDAELYDALRWAYYWRGKLEVSGNGYLAEDYFWGTGKLIGYDGRVAKFYLGLMPNSPVTITVRLYAQNLLQFWNFDELVETKTFTVLVRNGGNGQPPNGGDDDPLQEFFEEFPWKWTGIAVGALLAGLLIRRLKG